MQSAPPWKAPEMTGRRPLKETDLAIKLVTTAAGLRAESARLLTEKQGASQGLVPTMGALHEGHARLARTAVEQNDVVVASIFVNPLQFGEAADLDRYPRTLEADLALLDAEGVDLVFAPPVEEVYPGGEPMVRITSGVLAEKWEGASRPGHFRPEGRPAADPGPADGGGPELPGGDRAGADRAVPGRAGPLQPQPVPL